MGTGGFSQPQFGQPPQFGGGFGGGFGMQQQPPNQLVGINANPPAMDLKRQQQQAGQGGFGGIGLRREPPQTRMAKRDIATLPSLDQAKDFLGPDIMRELQRRSRPVSARDGFGGAEAGRINDMRYRAPGRVLPPGRFQPFPQPGGRPMPPQSDYNRRDRRPLPMPRPQPMPMPGYGNFPPRLPPRFQQPRPQPMPMPGYGGFPGDYMPLPRPQPRPRYQPALPSRLGSPTMYQGRGFTPNYGVPRSMIPPQEYQLFDQGGLGGFF